MHACNRLKLSPTASGWICFDCFQRFPPDAFPRWASSRIKLLNTLLEDYRKCQKTRPKQKNLTETIAEIEAELCYLQTQLTSTAS